MIGGRDRDRQATVSACSEINKSRNRSQSRWDMVTVSKFRSWCRFHGGPSRMSRRRTSWMRILRSSVFITLVLDHLHGS